MLKTRTVINILQVLIVTGLLSACNTIGSQETEVSKWLYDAGDIIDYKGIRTEARKNKVESKVDQ